MEFSLFVSLGTHDSAPDGTEILASENVEEILLNQPLLSFPWLGQAAHPEWAVEDLCLDRI